jgi:hypothetical protein
VLGNGKQAIDRKNPVKCGKMLVKMEGRDFGMKGCTSEVD